MDFGIVYYRMTGCGKLRNIAGSGNLFCYNGTVLSLPLECDVWHFNYYYCCHWCCGGVGAGAGGCGGRSKGPSI